MGYDLEQIDALGWAEEGVELCNAFVYTDVEFGDEISKEYKRVGVEVTGQRIVMAGYRLAKVLEFALEGEQIKLEKRRRYLAKSS